MRAIRAWPQALLSKLASIGAVSILIIVLLELELVRLTLADLAPPETRDEPQKSTSAPNRQDQSSSFVSASLLSAYLAANASAKLDDSQLDQRLSVALRQIGPDLRQMRDFTQLDDSLDIDIELAKRAWQLMREHARNAIAGRLQSIGPAILDNLAQAKVSPECISAIEHTIDGAKNLDSWAIQRKFESRC